MLVGREQMRLLVQPEVNTNRIRGHDVDCEADEHQNRGDDDAPPGDRDGLEACGGKGGKGERRRRRREREKRVNFLCFFGFFLV